LTPRVDHNDHPPFHGPRRRRRFDEKALAAHLEDLEDEVRNGRRMLDELPGSRVKVRS
jgi:hypothetical protein